MNSFERRALILGAIIAVVVSANIVYAAIGNNTLRQNHGAVMPLFNATGGGYYVHNVNVINAGEGGPGMPPFVSYPIPAFLPTETPCS